MGIEELGLVIMWLLRYHLWLREILWLFMVFWEVCTVRFSYIFSPGEEGDLSGNRKYVFLSILLF